MTDPALPPSLAAELADMRRRLDALERSPRLQSSTVSGGRLRIVDDAGEVVGFLGEFEVEDYDTGAQVVRHGVRLPHPDNEDEDILRVSAEDGMRYPTLGFSFVPYSSLFATTTSSTFTPLWVAWATDFPGNAIFVSCLARGTTAGTAGEARLKFSTEYGVFYSGVRPFSGDSSTSLRWSVDLPALIPGFLVGKTVYVDIEYRRTAGSGDVYTQRPIPTAVRDATTDPAQADGLVPDL